MTYLEKLQHVNRCVRVLIGALFAFDATYLAGKISDTGFTIGAAAICAATAYAVYVGRRIREEHRRQP
jgi:hypothetical protein